jgi:lipid A 4'-phosphatase
LSRASVYATFLVTLITAIVFWLWPDLDLAVAALFRRDNTFWGADPYARAYRFFFYWLPIVLMAIYAVAYILKRAGKLGHAYVSGRGLVFLAVSMALGPGLLVNLGFKDHWHRPRPVQVSQFGGPMEFRPYWRGDGACERNCSFVSGEVSTAAWLIAPASLVPPPLRTPAMAAALIITVLTALGRFAFGGHFLSDALFAALFTISLVQLLYRAIVARAPSKP